MKCSYCDSNTHLEVDCLTRKNERRNERALGWFFVCLLLPFWLFGALVGGAVGAVKAGFDFCEDAWRVSRKWTGAKTEENQGP